MNIEEEESMQIGDFVGKVVDAYWEEYNYRMRKD